MSLYHGLGTNTTVRDRSPQVNVARTKSFMTKNIGSAIEWGSHALRMDGLWTGEGEPGITYIIRT